MNPPRFFPALALSLVVFASAAAATEEVRFRYHDPAAASCAVVGDWNDWDASLGAMTKRGADFSIRLPLSDGYHRYRFLVDGTRKIDDPAATEWDPSKKGVDNSMIRVGPAEPFVRDFRKFPVLVDLPPADRVVTVGDLHGALPQMTATLAAAGLIATGEVGVRWTGGDATLVFTGDYMDRGDFSKEVVDLVRDLEGKAAAAGGRVVALLGNHEHFRITRFEGYKDPAARASFERAGLDFDTAVGPTGEYGRFFRNRPIAARVDRILFCHGGLSSSMGTAGSPPFSPTAWAGSIETALGAGRWGCAELGRNDSMVWVRDWWNDDLYAARALKAWDCAAVVFGHTPEAFGETGRVLVKGGDRILVDVGMCPTFGFSQGGCLDILRSGETFVFTAVYPDRPAEVLFKRRLLEGAALRELVGRDRVRELRRMAR